MASPVGHAMVGLTIAAVVGRAGGAPVTPVLLLGSVIAAGLPDLDLALAVVGLRGPRFHRNASHSLVVLLAVAGLAWAWGSTLASSPGHWALLAWSAALVSHPLLDVVTTGPAAAAEGWGVSLLWPLSRTRWWVTNPLVDSGDGLTRCRSLRCGWECVRPEVVRLGVVCAPLAFVALVW